MFLRTAGAGSLYWLGLREKNGSYLDGGKTYELRLPQPVPQKLFWSITVYDNATRSMIQTDQDKAALRSLIELKDAASCASFSESSCLATWARSGDGRSAVIVAAANKKLRPPAKAIPMGAHHKSIAWCDNTCSSGRPFVGESLRGFGRSSFHEPALLVSRLTDDVGRAARGASGAVICFLPDIAEAALGVPAELQRRPRRRHPRAQGLTAEAAARAWRRVLQGPLQDQIGLLAALRPHERVLVLLQLLGAQARNAFCTSRDRRRPRDRRIASRCWQPMTDGVASTGDRRQGFVGGVVRIVRERCRWRRQDLKRPF
jgi:hypothetical protein